MMVSANEIHHTIRKSCLAKGLDHDRATDIGAAVVWLARRGQDGCGAADVMLATTDIAYPLSIDATKDQLVLSSPRSAVEGIAAIDWLIASPAGYGVTISGSFDGMLLLGLLGCAAGHYDRAFQISVDGTDRQSMITFAGCTDWEIIADHPQQAFTLTCLAPLVEGNPNEPDRLDSLTIADDVWGRLSALAYQTYVPSSEQSRLSGAGAGLVDND
jgi:hypothetical protein